VRFSAEGKAIAVITENKNKQRTGKRQREFTFYEGNGRFPFRLGTTSYIIPDDIIPNLRHLSGRVDDVELVLFEIDGLSNMPSSKDVAEIARIAQEDGLSYTVHLPLDTRLGSRDETERIASVGKCRRVMDLMAPVHPFAWILHLQGYRRGDPPTDDPARWVAQNRRSLTELLNAAAVDPRKVCVETLDYDFGLVAGLVESSDLSVCLDIGHLIVNGHDVAGHLNRWFERARVFHVHGVQADGTDHISLEHLPTGLLEDLSDRLARLSERDARVVTLEVFCEADFERSIRVLQKRLRRWLI
jgi:sugar phosphate isomerase/epimerase